ncbi:unnamed protein product [Scytosiphon promiscuus]
MSSARKAKRGGGDLRGSAAGSRGNELGADNNADPTRDRCLQALTVSINQAGGTRQWYTETKELQLASLQICRACRGAHTVHLRVDRDIPSTVLATVDGSHRNSRRVIPPRVPRLRVRRVTWNLPSIDLMSDFMDALVEVEELFFGDAFDRSVAIRAWPSGLKRVEFGWYSRFNLPIVGVTWPASLEELTFGRSFNQPVEEVTWPASLQQLTFKGKLDQSVEDVKWPTSLRQLVFGVRFNHPIEEVTWPMSLQCVDLGDAFDQPIENVTWPTSLQELTIGNSFDHTIECATWPTSLQWVTFGHVSSRSNV